MMRLKAISILAAWLLLGTGWSSAQMLDDQQWFSVTLSQEIGDYRWKVEQSLRTRYGWAISDNLFSEVSLRRKINKHLALGANYRFGWKDPFFEPGAFHRFNFDVRLKNKWKKQDLELTFRPRIQVRFKPDEGIVKRKWYWRNKLSLSKKINKTFVAWTTAELFTQLNEQRQGLNLDEFRAGFGLDIDVGKRKELTAYYLWSNEFNQENPGYTHIMGLEFSYKLKKWKKAKGKNKQKD